ncbi:MAG TPA: hydantoinase/oxoprolinase family protein [Solirubrobacteraceae bacterium]|jgi:N-methylhydantoinase A|nr:hydantoinase/oxoprolinase family protein [Solirubrobacteraceae bacterium]
MNYRIGVDVGGTFTDFTVARSSGELLLWKEDTTPDDPGRAVLSGLHAVAEQLGTDLGGLLSSTELLVHGTTVATNMLIQRNGPTIGLLCTKGFRDVLYFRDGYKPQRFNMKLAHPQELVDRWLRVGVTERFVPDGSEIAELDEQEVRQAARHFAEAGVKAVAVTFLWSMLYPQHELRAAEILTEELPGVQVVCSHTVLPEIREWERTSATAISAYIIPRISEYLTNLERELVQAGLKRPPLIMQINGGCARIPDILRVPVNILASGPAAAPAAAMYFADSVGEDLITVDMGGTSLDVCMIQGGRAAMSRDIQVEDQPIGVSAVDVHSIGAGGGSIAWIDGGGALRVGPRSAGSRPGPACYDFGGEEPTVTDANVVLGYLDPDAFLGGRRRLRDDLSVAAVDSRVGVPLGLSTVEAAAGIVRVVNANMVGAIRAVSIERGLDPRRFTLVCGGGAGGLHATELARELGMQRVFVPLEAGVFCAFGMTVTDVRHDHLAALHAVSDSIDLDSVNALLGELERQAAGQLLEEGFQSSEIRLERSVDARYPGQVHEITVPVPDSPVLDAQAVTELERTFHERHRAQFAYSRESMPIECLHWRVAAVGASRGWPRQVASANGNQPLSAQPARIRQAFFAAAGGLVDTRVHDVHELVVGVQVEGPALVVAPTTTIVLHPGDTLTRPTADGFLIDVRAR